MTLKEIREKQAELVSKARAKLEEIKDDTPEPRAKEIETEYDSIMADHDKLEERAQREERVAAAEAKINAPDPRRPKLDDGEPVREGAKEPTYREAFKSWLKYGAANLTPEERAVIGKHRASAEMMEGREARAQSTTNSAGGYTIPTDLASEIVVSMKAYGGMLQVARILATAGGNAINFPTLDDTSTTAYLLSENTQATNEGDLTFGQKTLNAYKYASGPILVSEELTQDSAFDVEQVVRDAMAVRFGRKLNAQFTSGTGSSQPNGVVTASAAGVTAGSITTTTFDEIMDLFHSVDPAYRDAPGVRFMFHDDTLKILRKLKDSQNRYIWQPADVRAGAPATILDKPYVINQDMDQFGSLKKPVLFGDFGKYVIRRVQDIAIRRLVERYADYDQVGFIGFARFDGELMDTAAIKHITCPTA
jgi:HK97 family phage major capsid protein